MPGRSLKASATGIQRARQALERRNLIQKSLADEAIASWSTINNFFNGKPVSRSIFLEICHRLDLDWEAIAEFPESLELDQPASANSATLTPATPPANPAPSPWLQAVQQASRAAREALTPRILERIPRSIVREKYLPAIQRGVTGEQERVVAIVSPAGYGKSTILGDIYDELSQAETAWVGLILCSTLSLATGFSGLPSSDLATPTRAIASYAALPSTWQSSWLDESFGQSLWGAPQSLLEVVAQLNGICGRGVLLIDTLDLVVSQSFVAAFNLLLRQLLEHGTTVVFTCRDHEYNDYLEPTRERLPGLSQRVDRHLVPNFTPTEIRQAAVTFFHKLTPDDATLGQTFADKILALSADNRSLQDIIQNPLLLALLCDLFAKEGTVPPDLTVSKLYRRYWHEKVSYCRVEQSHFAPLAIEKENLCLTIARFLFIQSQHRLCESFYRDDLEIAFTKSLTTAYNHLLSEGVLQHLPSQKLHFFHQTLLEYAIAYWLTRQSARQQRDYLLKSLSQPETADSRTYWLPVLRQLLTIVESEAEFESLIAQLNVNDMGVFGTIAYAAISRDRTDALRRLLPTALELGEPHQRRLRQAFSAAPRHLIENTWDILLILLEQGDHAAASNTAQLAGALFERWWPTLKVKLPDTLAAIAQRHPSANQPDDPGKDDRAQLWGWLLHPCIPLLKQTPEPTLLAALREQIHVLGSGSGAAVIQLHALPETPEAAQQDLLERLLPAIVPSYESVERSLTEFIVSLLPNHLTSNWFSLGSSWFEVLHGSLPQGWDKVQAKAVGRWAARDYALLPEILRDLLLGETNRLRRNLTALTESINYGSGSELIQALEQSTVDSLTTEQLKRLVPLFVQSTVASLTPSDQDRLAQWLKPYALSEFECLHPILNVLADGSSAARQTLVQLVDQLPPNQQTQVRNQLLRFQPAAQHPPLSTLDQPTQKFLVQAYRQQAASDSVALNRLLAASQSQVREVALAASLELDQVSDGKVNPALLIPLCHSIFIGVRVNALVATTQLLAQGQPLSSNDLLNLCHILAQDQNQTVARQLCQLVATWVQQEHRVPSGVLDVLAEIPHRLLQQNLFEGGTARTLMDALKAIARLESSVEASVILSRTVHCLLTAINMIQLRNGESEMMDLVCAVHRLNQQFLTEAVREDCPLLAQRGWHRNICVIIRSIRRVEGHHSVLLDEVLVSSWCTSEVRGAVLEVRGS